MSNPQIPPGSTIGGDAVSGNKTSYQRAGRDIVGRDKNTFQAPRVGVSALHQLPSPPAGFTGRAAELAELRQAVREQGAAMCGLRGLGGVGKTALALVLAHDLAPDYPDAQIFLNLQAVTQPLAPAAVMAHVIRAYKPIEKLPDDPAQLAAIYRSLLAGQRALLLFDNARDAEQITPLLPPPGCLLLITSRQKFALPGLRAINLDSLPPADAEALLIRLAGRIGGRAAELAQLCGYLPLALTLAGSALAEREDLEPAQYAARLVQTRLTVLDEVEASLALSYDLLAPELQRLWCLLCVFPVDFDSAAAAAVWALEPDPSGEHLGDLLRLSLLDFNKDSRRYRMHDLARDFARPRLGDGERAAAELRQAGYYKDVLVEANRLYYAGGPDVMRGLALFDLERANILAGQAWAAARAGQEDAAARLSSSYAEAAQLIFDLRFRPRERIAWVEAALASARRLKNRSMEAIHLGELGLASTEMGQAQQAIGYFEQQLVITRELAEHYGEASALGNMGLAYAELSQPQRAIECNEQALVIFRDIGDKRAIGQALCNLGAAHADLRHSQQAIDYHQQALPIFREIGDRRDESTALGNLGLAYAQLGQHKLAIENYQQQLAIAREMAFQQNEALALWNMALSFEELKDRAAAVANAEQALALALEVDESLVPRIRAHLTGWQSQPARQSWLSRLWKRRP